MLFLLYIAAGLLLQLTTINSLIMNWLSLFIERIVLRANLKGRVLAAGISTHKHVWFRQRGKNRG